MSRAHDAAQAAAERAATPVLEDKGSVHSAGNARELPSASLDARGRTPPLAELTALDPDALALLVTVGC